MSDVRLLRYVHTGLSATTALDYYMVRDAGLEPAMWAEARGVTPRTVSKNVENAEELVEEDG